MDMERNHSKAAQPPTTSSQPLGLHLNANLCTSARYDAVPPAVESVLLAQILLLTLAHPQTLADLARTAKPPPRSHKVRRSPPSYDIRT
jgi:hypothetical protein